VAAEGAALLWLESPSNPGLDVCDIAALAEIAHRAGGLVAVDNTLATPLGQRPLELGADLSVTSDSKGLTGHSDLVLGHVAGHDPDLVARIRDWRLHAGAIAGPHEVWLAHRSLATLEVRLERQCANALAMAEAARDLLGAGAVRHPGLPGDPAYALAARQMRRAGGVLTLDLGDEAAAERFLAALGVIVQATSFGGVHSSAERRARWGGDDVPPRPRPRQRRNRGRRRPRRRPRRGDRPGLNDDDDAAWRARYPTSPSSSSSAASRPTGSPTTVE
jgi:cystathionine gamma-lyase